MNDSPPPGRSVPIWFFLFCCLGWSLATVVFGWAVWSTMVGSEKTGQAGRIALEIARFPPKAKAAVLEVVSLIDGDYEDEQLRVRRDADADYTGFTPVAAAAGIDVQGLSMRADLGALTRGWRVLIGAFRVDGRIQNAALLLSPDLKIVKTWSLVERPLGDVEPRPAYRKFVHGFELLPDGSAVFTFDGSVSLQRVDACGDLLWGTPGDFHHAVTLSESGQTVWTFSQDDAIAEVSVADGRILQALSLEEMIAANPTIDVLELRRVHDNDLNGNSRDTTGKWLGEPIHFNDVDPLPSAIADRFDQFAAGDVVISSRSLNLVFVVDPASGEIKWWRVGATQRQHDPDWLATGEISVLNNRMSRDYSEIVAIDPSTFRSRVLFDGRKNGFYTRIRGKHQMLPDGDMIVTSPQQGRAFEIGPTGETVLEIVNQRPGDAPFNYVISEMRWLAPDYLEPAGWRCGLAE